MFCIDYVNHNKKCNDLEMNPIIYMTSFIGFIGTLLFVSSWKLLGSEPRPIFHFSLL